jgi:hypothetical protein
LRVILYLKFSNSVIKGYGIELNYLNLNTSIYKAPPSQLHKK